MPLFEEVEYQPPEAIAGLQLLKDPQHGCSLLLKAQLAPQAIQQQSVAIDIRWRGWPWWRGSWVALIEEWWELGLLRVGI